METQGRAITDPALVILFAFSCTRLWLENPYRVVRLNKGILPFCEFAFDRKRDRLAGCYILQVLRAEVA
jgi:hypothetical protein